MDVSTVNNLDLIQLLRSIQNVFRQSSPTDWVEALRLGVSLYPKLRMHWQRLDEQGGWQDVAVCNPELVDAESKSWSKDGWRLLVFRQPNPLVDGWAALLFDCFYQHATGVEAKRKMELYRDDYETLRSAGFEGICIHRDGLLLEMNEAFLRLYGYSREEMVGMHMSNTIANETLPRVSALVSQGFEGVYETTALRKDGDTIQLEAQAKNCTFRGKPARVAAFRDIRGLKAIAIALEKAKESAENANQLKTQFLGDISHELRTPLNAVLGSTELLAQSELTSDQRRLLKVARKNGQDLMELLNDLLDITRIEEDRLELRIEPFDLTEMLHNAVRSMRRLRRGVILKIDFVNDLAGSWLGDERRIRQVVLNLLENAAKFTERGEICLKAERRENVFSISVSDTGIGIDEELKKLLFHRFEQGRTTKSLFGGIGLGLHISHRLASKMGGVLQVQSEMGQGSTFTLTIELRPAKTSTSVAPITSALPLARLPMTILLAEDTPVNQFVIRRMLEAMGHRVEVVEDGEEAVLAVESQDFDLVLMDVQMPRMGGVEAVKCVRGRGVETPIYALTANALESNLESCLHAGMDGFLTKPVSQEKLQEIFDRVQAMRADVVV